MTSGTRKYSYDIFVELGTLNLGVKFPCKVGTIWESPMKSIQANNKPDLVNGRAVFNQSMSNNFIIDFDMTKNTFTPRPSLLKILLYTEKGVREAGELQFDFTAVLNKRLTEMTIQLPLQKCPDKHAKLSFNIKTILREELKNGQPSFTSGMMPDIVGKQGSQLNPPTNDGFKKKVKINEIGPPSNLQFPVPIPPSIPPPPTLSMPSTQMQADVFKNERQLLLAQNKNTSGLLSKAQSDIENLKRQLRKSLEQKEDLYAQIESYNSEVDNLKRQNQELRQVEEIYNETQQQLITARTQLARIFNAATELGGPALTDKLQSAVGIEERQY